MVKLAIPEIEKAMPNRLLASQFLEVKYIEMGSTVAVNEAKLRRVNLTGNSLTKNMKLNL